MMFLSRLSLSTRLLWRKPKRVSLEEMLLTLCQKRLLKQNIIKKRDAMEVTNEKALARMHKKRAKDNVEVTQYDARPCMRQPDFGGTSPASKSLAESSTPQVAASTPQILGSNSAASVGDGQILGED